MAEFKFINVYETYSEVTIEADTLEEAKQIVENGDCEFEESDESQFVKCCIQILDDNGDVADSMDWED